MVSPDDTSPESSYSRRFVKRWSKNVPTSVDPASAFQNNPQAAAAISEDRILNTLNSITSLIDQLPLGDSTRCCDESSFIDEDDGVTPFLQDDCDDNYDQFLDDEQ